jgi:gamma-glutamyltranspeptidase/glutathione hydrolase
MPETRTQLLWYGARNGNPEDNLGVPFAKQRWLRRLALHGAVALLALSAARQCPAQDASRQAAPEAASEVAAKQGTRASRHMVVAAHPLASEAGLEILREGGSAVDAAIAVQMVLNLVEPQSSGIGGGAFILHFEKATGEVASFDGREAAPAAARPDRFLLPDGSPRDFDEAVASRLSVGVPGLLRALELAHGRHGRLPWARLFQPAIRLAEEGFPVPSRLNLLLHLEGARRFEPEARDYFFDFLGWPRPVGSRLRNPRLAKVLRRVAQEGADAFYRGELAERIVEKLAGDMTAADLAGYTARERAALCTRYRGHRICGMGPPSSGGPTVAMVLALVEPFDLGTAPLGTAALSVIAEAQKLAFADRDRYMADADFVPLPAGLLEPAYLAERSKLINPNAPMERAAAGEPPAQQGFLYGVDATVERSGTSHVSIVDAAGNAVAMTTTIEGAFGSRRMVEGFLLNNELTDFSFAHTDPAGRPVANRVEGGKRPRSSMAPTLVLAPGGRLRMVTGSPGGSRIILYVLKSLVCVIDWRCSAQAAADLVNFGSRNGPFEIELGVEGSKLAVGMGLAGQSVRPVMMTSGLHIILVREDGSLEGAADPRREGAALGD